MNTPNSLMQQARAWADKGLGLALATVVETWGSSPCPAGSQMVINAEAGFAGSVSGGCIETSVVSESLEVLKDQEFVLADYGVSGEVSFAAGLACGGSIKVMMEPLGQRLLDSLCGPRPAVRAVDLDSGSWAIVRNGIAEGELPLGDDILSGVAIVLAQERAQTIETGGRKIFLQPLIKRYRLFIIGAVRIAQALVPMATEAGFDVVIIDPRPIFSTEERFPGVQLIGKWPGDALEELGLDSFTGVVTLTHDAKPDDMALGLALRSDAFYIGALGSKKTHSARTERLQQAGYNEQEIGRIYAPIGMNIGARTPAEIAVSILAQVIAAKNDTGSRR